MEILASALFTVSSSFVAVPNRPRRDEFLSCSFIFLPCLCLLFLNPAFVSVSVLQTIVELAETGSLDLSIFCSTCLVKSVSLLPRKLMMHTENNVNNKTFYWKHSLSVFLNRYGSPSGPNTAPFATAASPSSTTTVPGWGTVSVRQQRRRFTRMSATAATHALPNKQLLIVILPRLKVVAFYCDSLAPDSALRSSRCPHQRLCSNFNLAPVHSGDTCWVEGIKYHDPTQNK